MELRPATGALLLLLTGSSESGGGIQSSTSLHIYIIATRYLQRPTANHNFGGKKHLGPSSVDPPPPSLSSSTHCRACTDMVLKQKQTHAAEAHGAHQIHCRRGLARRPHFPQRRVVAYGQHLLSVSHARTRVGGRQAAGRRTEATNIHAGSSMRASFLPISARAHEVR